MAEQIAVAEVGDDAEAAPLLVLAAVAALLSSPRPRQPRPAAARWTVAAVAQSPQLAISMDSHKVRKPPIAPQRHQQQVTQHQHQQQVNQHQQQQVQQPVIIYDASPKVIHTKLGDFMALVQCLTGPSSTSTSQQAQFYTAAAAAASGPGAGAGPSATPSASAMEFKPREFLLSPTAALSPAACLAAFERSVRTLPPHAPIAPYYSGTADGDDFFLSAFVTADLDSFMAALGVTPSSRPGILSLVALPPTASMGLFSPMLFDPSCFSWLSELSPFPHSVGTRAGLDQAPFVPSLRSSSLLLATPTMPSPTTTNRAPNRASSSSNSRWRARI
ncbi:hypothetical protein BAE44_0024144 [Dichanthelium oligosanthes]|uniref:VQ domain-containing protein n=1 Tax=Dichanthelium oligosanthes TaxID=888268 RepID=A0A1E5UPV2_9POAL|nr:hypothetical protein BAE44_0024144 [Dichanthelium oligosanthes]